MPKTKNPLLTTMRNIATTEQAYDDLPALLALSELLIHLQEHSNDTYKRFSKIICKPSLFNLSFEKLAIITYYSEKTIRRKCNHFYEFFNNKYSYFKKLPLPYLITRLFELRFNDDLYRDTPSLNTISSDDISTRIHSCNATQNVKQLCLSILDYSETISKHKFKRN